jgi:CD109 antigen
LNLSTFKVFVETAPKITFEDDDTQTIDLNIAAKYPFDEFVFGSAVIKPKVIFEYDGNKIETKTRKVNLRKGWKHVKFNIKNELSISTEATVEFTIQIREAGTGKIVERIQKVNVTEKHHIQLKKLTFTPDIPFDVRVLVSNFDGKPVTVNPQNLMVKVNFISEISTKEKNFALNLKNGTANFTLQPDATLTKIEVECKYKDTMISETFEINGGFNSAGAYLHLTYPEKRFEFLEIVSINYSFNIPRYKIGDSIDLTVNSNAMFNSLFFLVIGRQGIISSQVHTDEAGLTSTSHTLWITQEMAPEADIFVFYVCDNDGLVVSNQFKLDLGPPTKSVSFLTRI